ncbi:MAG: glycosyltransferase family 2 protein [Erythrobacter sp.]
MTRTDEDTTARPAQEAGKGLVSILIVAYNSRGYIRDCIGSVLAHTRPGSYEILLVDNGTDGTAAAVRAAFPEVRIIPSQGNIGFGRGNNLLASHARGEYLLLLNPDTKLVDPAIDRLLAFARSQPGAAAWGGLSTYPDGALDGGNFLVIPTIGGVVREMLGIGGTDARRAELEALNSPQRVNVLCGGFMLISRSAWDRLGGFDPSFLLYAEEIDLFTRLRALGMEAWLTPDSRIIHDVGSGNIYSPARTRFKFTGMMHYARRHWPGVRAQVVGVAYWLSAARRWVISTLLSPISSTHRARRDAYHAIVWNPQAWWRGYEGRSLLD